MTDIVKALSKAISSGIEKGSMQMKDSVKKMGELDRPLNVEIKEEPGVEDKSGFEKRLSELDKPLSADAPKNVYIDEVGNKYEYDESGYRPLTESEKQELIEKTGWDDIPRRAGGCKINDEGVIKFPCVNEELAGESYTDTEIVFERKTVELYDYRVEVTVPEFDYVFEVELPEEIYEKDNGVQFRECNRQLNDKIENDPEFAKKFTSQQIEQIRDGINRVGAPEGYTWHHEPEKGVMHLVDAKEHSVVRHTGGRALWGGGY